MPRPILQEVMKARAGVPTSDLLALLWAKKLQGYSITTITGIPPISFKADGRPLTAWSIDGNSRQSGTPTQDNPIMPEFVGERTENLFDWSAVTTGYRITWATGAPVEDATAIMSDFIPVSVGVYRVNASFNLVGYDANKTYVGTYDPNSKTFRKEYGSKTSYYDISDANIAYVKLMSYSATDTLSSSTMFNTGTAALPYEPFGYKLSLTSAGQTTPVYLGKVPTTRRVKKLVFDGTEDWQERPNFAYCDRFVLQKSGFTFPTKAGYCSHFEVNTNLINTYPVMIYNGGQQIVVNYSTKGTTTRAQFKQWLADQYAAGTPVTAWYVLVEPETGIVNEPLCKIGDYADELHSEDAGITIPTVRGSNTMIVETDLQPSEMSITGHIKPV